ncbi:unnamed protein product [Caenorhabditis auriculariae]|uniref:Uncharacterized protein n=1 Tax=Caenorhabditis auriculariae TaxID=2777116 RepID=A0A8S1HXY9_9PELO|nr:unnamed protein product [Caenorhabditis auriculariae]
MAANGLRNVAVDRAGAAANSEAFQYGYQKQIKQRSVAKKGDKKVTERRERVEPVRSEALRCAGRKQGPKVRRRRRKQQIWVTRTVAHKHTHTYRYTQEEIPTGCGPSTWTHGRQNGTGYLEETDRGGFLVKVQRVVEFVFEAPLGTHAEKTN